MVLARLGFNGFWDLTDTKLHELRIAMVRPSRDRLVGSVRVDEIYIGGSRPRKRGRGAEGEALVIVAVKVKKNRP